MTRFGAAAVFGGKPLSLTQMRAIMLEEGVERAYAGKARSDDYEKWARANPGSATLLARAMKAYNDHAIQD